jgi:soluble lytic murein transglycosylase
VRANADNASTYIKAVPDSLASDPGLAYERFVWRMRKDRYEDAATLIVETSSSAEALGRPEEWADRRALRARRLLRDGDPPMG